MNLRTIPRPKLIAAGAAGSLLLVVVLIFALRSGKPPIPNGTAGGGAETAASVFDSVDECDLLAAHPNDPERVSEGIADDAIVPRLATNACEDAIRRLPREPRFVFQLGRALLAANKRTEAAQQFQKAAQQDYGAALAYLGDAYQFGQGVQADPAQAKTAYDRARSRGFTPGEGQADLLSFDPGIFVIPFVPLLHGGDIESVRTALSGPNTIPASAYLFSLTIALTTECGAILRPPAVRALYDQRYPDQTWSPDQDASAAVVKTSSLAEYDARTFLRRHGCEGPVALRLKDNLNKLFLDR